ncbi:hypothetical protein ACLOJK_010878 [Asimina triloba]
MGRGEESSKSRAGGIGGDPNHQRHPPRRYGTFQNASSSWTQPPAIGFPHRNPPPHPTPGPSSSAAPCYTYEALPALSLLHVAQTPQIRVVEFKKVAEGMPVPRLRCCGIGIGWFLFIIGFFLAAIPWFVGALILMCGRVDYREKTGYAACTVAVSIYSYAGLIHTIYEVGGV